jgi:dethiobiotin synthetase
MRGLFVTGTDTEVGKTVVAGALVAALRAGGIAAGAFKPAVTGLDEPEGDGGKPHDHALLAACAGMEADDVAPYRYGPAVSPHLAAELAGEVIDPERLLAVARRSAEARGGTLVAEGVGGLLVPLTLDGYLVLDLVVGLGLPLVVVGRPGLGTINHTMLTVAAARARGVEVRGVVLTPWPEEPTEMQRSNAATIEALTGVEVALMARVAGWSPEELASAGAGLPYDRWLS